MSNTRPFPRTMARVRREQMGVQLRVEPSDPLALTYSARHVDLTRADMEGAYRSHGEHALADSEALAILRAEAPVRKPGHPPPGADARPTPDGPPAFDGKGKPASTVERDVRWEADEGFADTYTRADKRVSVWLSLGVWIAGLCFDDGTDDLDASPADMPPREGGWTGFRSREAAQAAADAAVPFARAEPAPQAQPDGGDDGAVRVGDVYRWNRGSEWTVSAHVDSALCRMVCTKTGSSAKVGMTSGNYTTKWLRDRALWTRVARGPVP